MEPSATPRPRKQDGRRERTRAAIASAASALFFEQGVVRTTIDEIAARAGVSVGSVYVHYGSKDALYLALVDEAAMINAAYVEAAVTSESPIERVFDAGDAYVRFALEHPVEFRLITMQINQPLPASPELEEARNRITERVEGRLTAIGVDLAKAMEAGEVLTLPIEAAVKFLWTTWTSVIGLTLREDRLRTSPEEMQATLRIARQILARGMGYEVGVRRDDVLRSASPSPATPADASRSDDAA